jgi:subtilisin family serine protease
VTEQDRPAWSEFFVPSRLRPVAALPLPQPVAEWAWGGSDGAGVRVAVVDSGVEDGHRLVGRVDGAVVVEDVEGGDDKRVVERAHPDLYGHGTAIAGTIRTMAPACELWSVQVLGPSLKGRAASLVAALRWTVQQRFDVVNLSLSTGGSAWFAPLQDLMDDAFFGGTVAVCAVNNVFSATFPAQFASVISVASSGPPGSPLAYNVDPPAEFGAPGEDVTVAWRDGGTATVTGNSFSAGYVSGLVTLIRAKHPGLPPFAVKSVLAAAAVNAARVSP